MSKSKKQRKAVKRARIQARKITPAKLLRLALKTLLFSVFVAVLVAVLIALDVALVEERWFQLLLMAVCYVGAFPYVFSEFRAKV